MKIVGFYSTGDQTFKWTAPQDCRLVGFVIWPSIARDITLPPAVGNFNGDPLNTHADDVLTNSAAQLNIDLIGGEDYYVHATGVGDSAAGYVVIQLYIEPVQLKP